jgi:hypothetical protein
MPAYEGEDHWSTIAAEALGYDPGKWGTRFFLMEKYIRQFGRNLAIAGALAHAFTKGFLSCRLDCAHRHWDD